MKRVVVIGCAGTGKTTFARKLAKKVNLPLIHLDSYYHQKKFNYYNNKEAWRKKENELTAQSKWIIDGNYSSTLEERVDKADTVIFLNFPRRVYLYRLVKRQLQHSEKKPRSEMPSGWTEKISFNFLKLVWLYQKYEKPRTIRIISRHKNKTKIIFNKPTEVKKYLETL